MTDSAQAGIQAANRNALDAPPHREFTAAVTAIREVARVDGRQVWQIALSQTLFSTGRNGTGVLIATARSGKVLEIAITAVEKDSDGELWHTTDKPLQEGTQVRGTIGA